MIEGFTAGIAVVIALQQVPAALGITEAEGAKVWQSAADAVHRFAQAPSLLTPAAALVVAVAILLGGRYLPRVPFSLIAVAVATLIAQLFHLDIARIGAIPTGFAAPTLSFLHLGELTSLIAPALAVAALAALESLLPPPTRWPWEPATTRTGNCSGRGWRTSPPPCSAACPPPGRSPAPPSTCAPAPAPGSRR